MIKLRLKRMGAKKRPSYRIVAAEGTSPRDGRFIETLGYYDPLTDPATVRIDEARARHFLGNGAQPTDTVRDIFIRQGLIADPKKRPVAVEGETARVAPA